MKKQKLLDQKKTVKKITTKENKTESTEKDSLIEILTSIHNTTKTESTEGATLKIDGTNKKLIELFGSNPNETKKTSNPPYWNKNSILGFRKKHKADDLSINNGGVAGNISDRQQMLNEKRSNSSHDIQNEKEAKR